ncbi:hypothetical protein R5H30_11740 [Sulfitobacter sp. D35]|uniref:hypothetical protein n=1 Tax=Sulfitobacter sp. D35 TaxID=3083252 RepID=UPI00296E7E4C|nr:hypothetical protein [Sulfitobacter sp. D35]MDW4498657.1 hypothetical protein [Sulfitobacter sp. D35]
MFKRLFALALVFGAAATAPPAETLDPAQFAAIRCAPRDLIVERLESRYEEHAKGAGLQTDTRLIELWSSKGGATWTILLTTPDGRTCILAAGEHWTDYPLPPALGAPS